MPSLTLAALAAIALAAPTRLEGSGVHLELVGSASLGIPPNGINGDTPPWLRNIPVYRYGAGLAFDLVEGSASSLQLAVPLVLVSSRVRFVGSGGVELGGWELVPELRARIRLYTRLDLVVGAGVGMLFHDVVVWDGNQTHVDHTDVGMGYRLSAVADWAVGRHLSFHLGPEVLLQDSGVWYLSFAGGFSWAF